MTSRILIVNGPDSGELKGKEGTNDPVPTMDDIRRACERHCVESKIDLDFRQSDDHQVLLEWLQKDSKEFDGLIFNPDTRSAADSGSGELYESAMQAIARSGIPAVEVRLSNIYKTGEKDSQQLHKPGCDMGFVCGFGLHSYLLAINAVAQRVAT
jgi:3-dehydroquinate dehydratase-2